MTTSTLLFLVVIIFSEEVLFLAYIFVHYNSESFL